MILRRHAAMAWTGRFLAKSTNQQAWQRECLSRSTGREGGKGFFDCVVVCFAHDNFAPDDSARHAAEEGYRFLGEFRVGATMGLLTGTIAPFDGSAAALALVSTSS
jgi:hypothetical protein